MKDLLSRLAESRGDTNAACPQGLQAPPKGSIPFGVVPESLRGPLAFGYQLLRDGQEGHGKTVLDLVGYAVSEHFSEQITARRAERKPPLAGIGIGQEWQVFGIEARVAIDVVVIELGSPGGRRGTPL